VTVLDIPWYVFLIGLCAGFFLEWLIELIFWRRQAHQKTVGATKLAEQRTMELKAAQAEIAQLKQEISMLKSLRD
jgi:ribulose kinase